MQLQNKIVVITGANRGLGASLAQKLLQSGCQVIRTDVEASESSDVQVLDITKSKEVDAFAKRIAHSLGRIDIWINNAGIRIPQMRFSEVNDDQIQHLLGVNFLGVVHGCQAAASVMLPGAVIINILSSAALKSKPHSAAYAASKAAATSFARSIREELRDAGISVVNIYPGGMKTHFFDEQVPKDYNRHMEPEYVANLIVKNLASEKPEEEFLILNPDQGGKL